MNSRKFLFVAFIFILLASCSTGNHVTSSRSIQKRKYTNGWFIRTKGNFKKESHKVVGELKEDVLLHAHIEQSLIKDFKLNEAGTLLIGTEGLIEPITCEKVVEENHLKDQYKTELESIEFEQIVEGNITLNEDLYRHKMYHQLETDPFASASLIISIVCVLALVTYFLSFSAFALLSTLALGLFGQIFGAIGMIRIKRRPRELDGFWMAFAGTIICTICLAVFIGYVIIFEI